jgi:bifunctional non-homologous end joining protein LigD
MLPVEAASLPDDESQWAFEVDWGGQRVLLPVEGGRTEGVDQWPELKEMARELGSLQVVLDGELVVLDPDTGRPNPKRLEHRVKATSDSSIRRLAKSSPAVYLISDLLFLDGHRTTPLPWEQRRSLLDRLELEGPSWKVPSAHPGEGRLLLEATRAQGLPGVVAKRLDSPYLSGETSDLWIRLRA